MNGNSMRALIVVDVQNDFVEGGALAVTGGLKVASDIARHLSDHRYDLVVASKDWHNPDSDNGGHFAEHPDFAGTWPVHCVAGTHGARLADPVSLAIVGHIIHKGVGEPAYSALEGFAEDDGEPLVNLLHRHHITDVTVVGLALDFCVKATALDAADLGFNTTVLTSLTASVNPDNTPSIVEELASAGVKVS